MIASIAHDNYDLWVMELCYIWKRQIDEIPHYQGNSKGVFLHIIKWMPNILQLLSEYTRQFLVSLPANPGSEFWVL